MLFEVKSELTKKDFFELQRVNAKTPSRWHTVKTILCVFGIAVFVQLSVLIVYYRMWTDRALMLRMGLLVLFLLMLPLVQRFTAAQAYRANRSLLNAWYRFEDEQIEAGFESMSAQYAYSAFTSLYHSRGIYYLYVDKGHAFVLPERCFTHGDPAAFGKFIAEKTGLEMKEIK